MSEQPARRNGRFELYYRKGWAYLSIHPPIADGRPVYPEEIENRMKLLGVPSISASAIRALIREGNGEPVAIVEWPAGRALASVFTIEQAKDGMSASMSISPPRKGAAPPSLSDALEALETAGIVYGIDKAGIERMLRKGAYDKPLPVAAGSDPVFGKAHRLLYHFNTNRGKPYMEMDFGRINLKELNFIDNRSAGDLLAELVPPVQAVDGCKVSGEMIPAHTDKETVVLRAGQNTRLSDDKTGIYAECDGNVRLVDDVVLVEPVIYVKNVGFETGNIRFKGSVVIEGSIADGFIVEAGGDIQVGSGVGKATLRAGGSILLKTGINGKGKGIIECGGDIFAKYLESCQVTCRANVLVEEAIMNSKVVAYNHCVLNGRRSEVIASDLIVGGSFWCKKLGNFNEAETRLAVGVQPEPLIDYRAKASMLALRQEELDRLENQLEQLAKLLREGRADERAGQAYAQLQQSRACLVPELETLRDSLPHLRDRLVASHKSLVIVEDEMYKGVIVSFGTMEYRVADAGARKMILKAGNDKIIEAGFNSNERPTLSFDAPSSTGEV